MGWRCRDDSHEPSTAPDFEHRAPGHDLIDRSGLYIYAGHRSRDGQPASVATPDSGHRLAYPCCCRTAKSLPGAGGESRSGCYTRNCVSCIGSKY